MRKLVLTVAAAGVLVTRPANTDAQFVVNDPIHMGVHIGEFAKRLAQWSETVQNYQVIKDARTIAGVTKDLTGEVKDLTSEGLALQRRIQEDLRKVHSIVDLRISNPAELFARALAMSGGSSGTHYLPHFSKAQRLRIALQNKNPEEDIKTIFSVFSRTSGDSDANARMSSTEYVERREESAVSAYAYEKMNQKKKIQTALNYYKIADEMTGQSIEMNATLKNPGRYSMTEGERMAMIHASNENMVRAMQLRQEADRLISESTQKGPAHIAAERVYTDLLAQKQLIDLESRSKAY
ncbi:hypothetical protein [Rufibacter tibetensis]|uniref:Uncharacterized protein n=1 Tax=Rufibacter tibetensis TaxID=512763 RepID=A0A0P0C8L8_9BACT|nr:hypothetical protein [Rufibacter tibetensis]ALJ01670.1 hypothetical protein DC20_21685 [Rufibacter tibetensis]